MLFRSGLLLQVAFATPALADGARVTVSTLVETAGEQVPLPFAVSVNVTIPLSVAAGVYVGVSVVPLVIVPAPLCVQSKVA